MTYAPKIVATALGHVLWGAWDGQQLANIHAKLTLEEIQVECDRLNSMAADSIPADVLANLDPDGILAQEMEAQ